MKCSDIDAAIKRLQRAVVMRANDDPTGAVGVYLSDLRLTLEHLLRCGECAACQEHMLTPHQAQRCPRMWKKLSEAEMTERCRYVWNPGVLHHPLSGMPQVRTRCRFRAGHEGDHSWGPEFDPDDPRVRLNDASEEDPELQGDES